MFCPLTNGDCNKDCAWLARQKETNNLICAMPVIAAKGLYSQITIGASFDGKTALHQFMEEKDA